jgi:hypothetical protein
VLASWLIGLGPARVHGPIVVTMNPGQPEVRELTEVRSGARAEAGLAPADELGLVPLVAPSLSRPNVLCKMKLSVSLIPASQAPSRESHIGSESGQSGRGRAPC